MLGLTSPPPPLNSITQPYRILVVDDSSVNRRTLENLLKTKYTHIAVKTASDGLQAVTAVDKEEKGFDLIFMDIQMPIMGGEEATRTIKQKYPNANTKIIACTSVSQGLVIMESGFHDYLHKNYDSKTNEPSFTKRLESLIEKYLPNAIISQKLSPIDSKHTPAKKETLQQQLINAACEGSNLSAAAPAASQSAAAPAPKPTQTKPKPNKDKAKEDLTYTYPAQAYRGLTFHQPTRTSSCPLQNRRFEQQQLLTAAHQPQTLACY